LPPRSSPEFSDLDSFTLDEQDIQELKKCKPTHCDVQLPSEAIDAFQQSVNWSSPDSADQVNRLAKKMTIEAITPVAYAARRIPSEALATSEALRATLP